jgi:hypothetical protein
LAQRFETRDQAIGLPLSDHGTGPVSWNEFFAVGQKHSRMNKTLCFAHR